jgi:hemoglobin
MQRIVMDIASKLDIKLLVDTFYNKLAADELLKPIFIARLGTDDWQSHLNTIYNFWETVLLGATTYKGQSFMPHSTMQLEQLHFDKWLLLFDESVDALFDGITATEAKKKAHTMAILFMSKINYYKEKGGTGLI